MKEAIGVGGSSLRLGFQRVDVESKTHSNLGEDCYQTKKCSVNVNNNKNMSCFAYGKGHFSDKCRLSFVIFVERKNIAKVCHGKLSGQFSNVSANSSVTKVKSQNNK